MAIWIDDLLPEKEKYLDLSSKAPRPWNLKPPKCPTCRNLLHPAFDHSKCGIGKDKP